MCFFVSFRAIVLLPAAWSGRRSGTDGAAPGALPALLPFFRRTAALLVSVDRRRDIMG